VSGRENDRGVNVGFDGLEPARGTNAPAVTRGKTSKTEFWARGGEVIACSAAEGEELDGHLHADTVATSVFGAGITGPVAKKASERVQRARFQRSAEDVA